MGFAMVQAAGVTGKEVLNAFALEFGFDLFGVAAVRLGIGISFFRAACKRRLRAQNQPFPSQD